MSMDFKLSDAYQTQNNSIADFKTSGVFEKTSINQIAGLTNKRKLKNLVKQTNNKQQDKEEINLNIEKETIFNVKAPCA